MDKEKCCDTCKRCLYIGEGDFVCDEELVEGGKPKLIKEDHAPTDHYFWCGGEFWQKM